MFKCTVQRLLIPMCSSKSSSYNWEAFWEWSSAQTVANSFNTGKRHVWSLWNSVCLSVCVCVCVCRRDMDRMWV